MIPIKRDVPLIGRNNELAQIEALLQQSGTLKIACIQGSGGIGKTRLLQEVIARYQQTPDTVATHILDFDMWHLHAPGSLKLEIARQLGGNYFQDYRDKFDRLAQIKCDASNSESETVWFEQKNRLESDVQEAFTTCYRALETQRHVIVLLDTVEKIQDTKVWNDINNLLKLATNTLVLLSGRKANQAYMELSATYSPENICLICLAPLNEADAYNYIRSKEDALHIRIAPDLRTRLVKVVAGRPMLLDLACEWVARNIPMNWLVQRPIEELMSLSDADEQEFETQLVRSLRELPTLLNQVALNMAYVYPMNGPIMAELLDITPAEQQALFEELNRLVFIKQLPNGNYTLHDEMRQMVIDHIWNEIDHNGARRVQISQQIAHYYQQQAELLKLQAKQPLSANYQDRLRSSLQQDEFEQAYWVCREQQLEHQFNADPQQGWELFEALYGEAKQQALLDQRAPLLEITKKFVPEMTAEQQYGWSDEQTGYWLSTTRLENFGKAEALVEEMLVAYSGNVNKEVNLLTRQFNIAKQRGNLLQAAEYMERAIQICKHKLPGFLGTVHTNLGLAYRLMGKLSPAKEQYELALEHEENESKNADIYNSLGFVECLLGHYDLAFEYCRKALAIREQQGDEQKIALSYSTFNDIYRFKGQYAEAKEWLIKALTIFERLHDQPNWLAKLYTDLGTIYYLTANKLADFREAEVVLQKALDENYIAEKPRTTHVLGCVYRYMGDLERALDLFRCSTQLAQSQNDKRSEINNLLGSAEVCFLKWQRDHQPQDREQIIAADATLKYMAQQGYELFHHTARMQRLLGDLAYAEQRFDTALEHYADAFSQLGGRVGGYGLKTFDDELYELGERIDALPPHQATEWCNTLERCWKPIANMSHQGALLGFCLIHRKNAHQRLLREAGISSTVSI